MEAPSVPDRQIQQLPRGKGGLRTMPFIIANETLQKIANFGLVGNMIVYFITEYNMDAATAARVLFVWSGMSNILPIPGALISDSYLGRFRVIGIGTIACLFGMILLWLTAVIPAAQPLSCNLSGQSCTSPTFAQLALLYASLALMSIGSGGIGPCSLAFGADQLNRQGNSNNERVLQSFFSWYYASTGLSIIIGMTVIVYVQEKMGWKFGFAVPVVLMFLSTVFYFVGSPLYIKVKPNKSVLAEFAQVIVVSVKNKHLAFPPKDSEGWYHHKDSMLLAPTDTLRFLNKACIIRNPGDLNPDGSASKPWNLCTVRQVEDFKSVIKVIPIWSTCIVISMVMTQSFQTLQARTMDRHIGPNFEIPAGSFIVFSTISLTIWVLIYDSLIIPIMRKFTRKQHGLGIKQRLGLGLLISCAATATSAWVEGVRRRTAIRQGFSENGYAVVDMSAMWLVPQNLLLGIADAFNALGQIEFYYHEFPKSLASMGVALLTLGVGLGSLMGSLIVQCVDDITKRGGQESWVSSNLNEGHYDYYYWLLTILGLVNFLFYLVCSCTYGTCKEEGNRVSDDKEEN